jgi:hypothetical protein
LFDAAGGAMPKHDASSPATVPALPRAQPSSAGLLFGVASWANAQTVPRVIPEKSETLHRAPTNLCRFHLGQRLLRCSSECREFACATVSIFTGHMTPFAVWSARIK